MWSIMWVVCFSTDLCAQVNMSGVWNWHLIIRGNLRSKTLNWAHRSMDKHTTHMIDHTIYSVIEEWNNAKMACSCECFSFNQRVIR